MNKLLRPPILAKTLCVLPTGARRAVNARARPFVTGRAPFGPRHTACEARYFTTLAVCFAIRLRIALDPDLATLLHE